MDVAPRSGQDSGEQGQGGSAVGEPRRLTPEETAALVRKWQGLLWGFAWKVGHGLSRDDLEELVAVGTLKILDTVRTYDAGSGLAFSTYAYRGVKGTMSLEAVRMRARGVSVPQSAMQAARPQAGDLDAVIPDTSGMQYGQMFAAPESEPVPPPDLWERVAATLRGRERLCVLWRFRDGMALKDIGKRLGVSKERARQLVCAGTRHLRENKQFVAAMEDVA